MLLACSFGFYGLLGEKLVNAKNLMNGQKLCFVSWKCPSCGRGQNGTCGISAFSLSRGLQEGRMLWPLSLSVQGIMQLISSVLLGQSRRSPGGSSSSEVNLWTSSLVCRRDCH